MKTEPPGGLELTKMLEKMKKNVLNRVIAEEEKMTSPLRKPKKSHRVVGGAIAILVLVGAGTAGGAFALGFLPSPFAAKTPSSMSSTPLPVLPSEPEITFLPSPTPTQEDTETEAPVLVNGFDADLVYRMCIEADLADDGFRGFATPPVPAARKDTSVTPGVIVYTQDSVPPDQWSSVVTITVDWATDEPLLPNIVGLCTASGNPATPTVVFNRSLD